MQYRPAYPLWPFEDLAAARTWVTTLVQGYHHEHRHSTIHLVTLGPRHAGLDTALPAPHDNLCEEARLKTPLRLERQTRNWRRVTVVPLDPEKAEQKTRDEADNPIEKRTAIDPLMRRVVCILPPYLRTDATLAPWSIEILA